MEAGTESHSQLLCGESKLEVSIRWPHLELEEPWGQEKRKFVRVSGDGGHQSNISKMNQLSRASKGHARFCTRSSASMLQLLSWCLSGTPNIGRYCISDSFDSMWDSYLPVGFPCSDSVWGLLSSHTVYCFVVFDCCMLFFPEEGMERK